MLSRSAAFPEGKPVSQVRIYSNSNEAGAKQFSVNSNELA